MNTTRTYWVYILASDLGGTLYVGVTNDLIRRVHEHRVGATSGFTSRHVVHRLVYFEPFDQIEFAIRREKRLKKWTRAWKVALRQTRTGTICFPRLQIPDHVGASSPTPGVLGPHSNAALAALRPS